jgi:hypothetical protein
MRYEALVLGGGAGWQYGWLLIPNEPRYAATYDWPGVKAYADNVGVAVRELNPLGIVTREYHPSIEDGRQL